MKKLALLVVLALVLLRPGFAHAEATASTLKFGLVDLQQALNDIEEGKKAKATLKADFDAKQKKFEIRKNEIEQLRADFEKQRLIASEAALKTKEDDLRQKMGTLQLDLQKAQQDLSTQEMQVTQKLLGELRDIVKSIGAEKGYTAIFEKSQDVLLYSPIATDLTADVIGAYNKKKK